jgi:hypothetical protein
MRFLISSSGFVHFLVFVHLFASRISAACHDIGGESDAAEKPLMWGAVYQGDNKQLGHCTITSRNVVEPIAGQIYE